LRSGFQEAGVFIEVPLDFCYEDHVEKTPRLYGVLSACQWGDDAQSRRRSPSFRLFRWLRKDRGTSVGLDSMGVSIVGSTLASRYL
jgi:hypothetical protein